MNVPVFCKGCINAVVWYNIIRMIYDVFFMEDRYA